MVDKAHDEVLERTVLLTERPDRQVVAEAYRIWRKRRGVEAYGTFTWFVVDLCREYVELYDWVRERERARERLDEGGA